MKAATIALIVRAPEGQTPEIIEVLSDDREISLLETEVGAGETDPLEKIYQFRANTTREDDEFADYVEDLLSQPFLKPEVQEHGVQWLRSKIRIDQYQKSEAEAAKIIAKYALQVFTGAPHRRDFLLAGPRAQVRVRVFIVEPTAAQQVA